MPTTSVRAVIVTGEGSRSSAPEPISRQEAEVFGLRRASHWRTWPTSLVCAMAAGRLTPAHFRMPQAGDRRSEWTGRRHRGDHLAQLPMDIRLAATDARFGFSFACRGLVPEANASSAGVPAAAGRHLRRAGVVLQRPDGPGARGASSAAWSAPSIRPRTCWRPQQPWPMSSPTSPRQSPSP